MSEPVSLENRIPSLACDAFISHFSCGSLGSLICKFRGLDDWVLALILSLPKYSWSLPFILHILQCHLLWKVILSHQIEGFSPASLCCCLLFPILLLPFPQASYSYLHWSFCLVNFLFLFANLLAFNMSDTGSGNWSLSPLWYVIYTMKRGGEISLSLQTRCSGKVRRVGWMHWLSDRQDKNYDKNFQAVSIC